MKQQIKKKSIKVITSVLVVAIFCMGFIATTSAENITLKLLKTEYDFDSVCDYYQITTNELISFFSTPTISDRTIVKGSVLEDRWEIKKTRTTITTILNETISCETKTYKENQSEYQECTTTSSPYNVSKIDTYWSTDFLTTTLMSKGEIFDIRYCGKIQREYIKGVGWTIQLDNIPTILGNTYPQYAWWNNTFSYRQNFSINTGITKSLVNFTARVTNLNTTDLILKGLLKSDCSDLRVVVNDTLSLPYEIEPNTCNNAQGNTTLYFLIPRTISGTDNYAFYYGNNNTIAGEDKLNTWASYDYVYHFNNLTDSKRAAALAVVGGAVTGVQGLFGNSSYYDGNGDGLKTNWTLSGTNPLYISMYVSPDASQLNQESHFFSSINATAAPITYNALYQTDFYCNYRSDNNTEIWNDATCTNGGIGTALGKGWIFYSVNINITNNNLLYVNGTFYVNNSLASGSWMLGTINAMGLGGKINTDGNFQAARWYTGFIDELRISHSYKIPEWTQAEFLQTSTLSNVIENYGNIQFFSQIPSDITSLNLFEERANITFNITTSIGTITNSTVLLFYKTNSTTNDCLKIINGTEVCGYKTTTYKNATGTLYTFSIGDEKVYPATENLDFQTEFRNVEHSPIIQLNNSNDQAIMELLNITSADQYNYFEIDINSSIDTAAPFYICNNSYSFSSSIVGNPNCAIFYTVANINNYNHTHNTSVINASRHLLMPFGINTTTGKIAGIYITPNMYFAVKGQNGVQITLWGVNTTSRIGAMRVSANNGNAYTNLTGTVDMHLHQFKENDTLYYYAQANNTDGISFNSTLQYDILDLGGLPPSPPFVYVPTNTTYTVGSIIGIAYTKAVSPNNYNITQYLIGLYNSTYAYSSLILENNSPDLTYSWNTSGLSEGNYSVGVTAIDQLGQNSTGYSEIFTFVTTTSTTSTTSASTTTTTTLPEGAVATNKTLYIYSIMLPIFAFLSTILCFYLSHSKIKEKVMVLNDLDGNPINNTMLDKTTYLLQPILPLISSLLWFQSSFTTINIRFIDNFTVTLSPYYDAAGNPEIGALFSALGVIMGLYFIFTVLSSARQSGILKGGVR